MYGITYRTLEKILPKCEAGIQILRLLTMHKTQPLHVTAFAPFCVWSLTTVQKFISDKLSKGFYRKSDEMEVALMREPTQGHQRFLL